MDDMLNGHKHCDDYIDDPTQPEVLRKFLERARSPAHGMMLKEPFPKLFAVYNGVDWRGVAKGDRVRIVMASRLGDVGITNNLDAEHYMARCFVDQLTDFQDTPT